MLIMLAINDTNDTITMEYLCLIVTIETGSECYDRYEGSRYTIDTNVLIDNMNEDTNDTNEE